MTPAARIQAAIEILDHINTGVAAEKALTGWARRSRFAGSKDRAAIRDHVFSALRCRNSFAAMGNGSDGRAIMLGAVANSGGDAETLFSGVGHGPSALNDQEKAWLAQGNADDPVDLPEWLWLRFQESLGPDARKMADALRNRAPVFLRVNVARCTVEDAQQELMADGVTTDRHPSASTALVVTEGARAIRNAAAYTTGLVELQDGASQALAEALPLRPSQRVLDYCAGGGGKTLAMGGLHPDLSLFAHDAVTGRMADLPSRAKRAGLQVTDLKTTALRSCDPFDLVLCDVPCSGSGSWRRSPEGKWILTPEKFDNLLSVQRKILDEAAGLVKPGGVLAYATCSILRPENEDQVNAFLDRSEGWTVKTQHNWFPDGDTDGFFLSALRLR